ncbi:receptor [Pantoea sp. FN060301]|uniref:receptor n=1 Tax=Pantoea sp. FN060301 TaxID=3420380 RepID=UPI003D17533E
MKRLALSLLLISAGAQADVTLPYIAIKNNDTSGSGNGSAIYSLNAGGGEQLIGSVTYPSLSDNGLLTVATYVPVSSTSSGVSGWTDELTWRYGFSGFSDVGFRGTTCTSCSGMGYKAPVSISSSEMTVPYNPLGGQFGFTGLVLSESLYNYLLGLGVGHSVTATTAPYTSSTEVPASSQSNVLQKLGDYTLDNKVKLGFSVDPITGEVTLQDGATGTHCTAYQYIALKGQLCEVMTYTYQGGSVTPYAGTLSMGISQVNPLLTQFQGTGLNVSLTFDEKVWYTLSNGSIGTPATFADSFLQQPAKNGGSASLKMFFPDDFIKKVANQGNAANLTEIATLCLNKPLAQLGADFCFHPGNGFNITPLANSIEIKPDNPDYSLDSSGHGGSGKGKVGTATPISIPYTIYTSSKDPAVAVSVRVTGPSKAMNGQDYCLFSGAGAASTIQVPVPGNVLVGLSQTSYAHNCAGNAIAVPPPSTSAGEWVKQASTLDPALSVWQTPLVLKFPMDDPVTQKTFDGGYWDGMVSAQGTIEVSASWN